MKNLLILIVILTGMLAFGQRTRVPYSGLNITNSVVSGDLTTNSVTAAKILDGEITSADISAAAAIPYSKLSLGSSILSSDISASAAIPYSKLTLGTSIVNADINTSAAIAYSKLNLANSIVSNDITVSAITSNKILDGEITSADISASAAIPYSKLSLGSSIVSTDLSTTGVGAGTYSSVTVNTKGQVTAASASQDLTTSASGVLPIANGGTNNAALSAAGGTTYYGDGTKLVGLTNGTNGQVLKSTGGTSAPTWGTAAGGGAKNYVSGGDAESGTTGFATYLDAVATRPVDGTGGTAVSTFTTSATAPLEASNSFLWTKTGTVSRQGEGFSYAFTIDAKDKAKVLQISFDYLVSSGTFVAGTSTTDSDMIVYIYDVTNAVLIEPSSIKLLSNSTTIADKFSATFQTASNSTSYRLIAHTATASALDYTLQFDSIAVSPSVYPTGTPISEWVAYTPAFVGFGTVINISTYWRRVGSSIETYGRFTSGTPTAVVATMGLPTGQVIGGAVGLRNYYGVVNRNGGTHLQIMAVESQSVFRFGVGASSHGDANGDTILGAGETVYFNSSGVPILGWGASTQLSSETDTRVVAMYAASQIPTGTLNSSVNVVRFAVTKDSHGAYDAATGLYTVRVAGWYEVSGVLDISCASNAVGDYRVILLRKSGVNFTTNAHYVANTTSTTHTIAVSGKTYAEAGDTLGAYSQTNTTTPSYGAAAYGSSFSIARISGPSAIAASETIGLNYTGIATGTLSAAYNPVTFPTKLKDSHGLYSGSTATIQTSGQYDISAFTNVAATFTAGQYVALAVYVDGASVRDYYTYTAAAANSGGAINVRSYPLKAGQTVQIRSITNGTTPTFTASAILHEFSLVRTGNY